MSSNEQFEREFEAFLKEDDSRIAALYRKLPRPEPDAKLDSAVLAMARRAAAATAAPRARAPRWIPAMSVAAVVALAAGIAFRIGPQVWHERDTRTLQKSVDENAASGAAVPAPASSPAPAQETQPAQTDTFKTVAPKPVARPSTAAQNATVPPAPAPSAPAGYAAPMQESRVPLRKLEPAARPVAAPAPQAFPETESREQKPADAATATSAGDATESQANGTLQEKALDRQRDERMQSAPEAPALKMRSEGTPPPMAAPVAAPPPPPPREESAAPSPASAPAPEIETRAAGGAPAESALAAPAAAAKAAHLAPTRSKDPNAQLYPEHWLANIRTMLRENKHDQALRSLAEFRKMYPDYHLPDDLRDLK